MNQSKSIPWGLWVKYVAWGLLGLVLLLVLIAAIAVQRLKPDYDGQVSLQGLDREVEVYFDPYGIPHIYADQEKDAFRALGYVHAQDRLWQMELLRRVAKGRLSEVFGRDLLDADRLFLSLGIDHASAGTVANLDREDRAVVLAEAYLEGVNAFVSEGPTPIEFLLTGIDKTPFELRDIYNSIGYMAYTFATAHRTDPLLTALKEQLDSTYFKDLGIGNGLHPTRIPTYPEGMSQGIAQQVHKALEKLPLPQFHGSNGWVLAPSKTKSGKVILANDPHIGFASPAVWYEAHLVTPDYEEYGFHLAGIPYPLLGHNRQNAYGLTMFLNDDTDFYFETPHPEDSTRYAVPNGWETYESHTYSIPVKDSSTVTYTYRSTRHGPLVNGISKDLQDERPVSMSWKYLQQENKLLHVLHRMSHARELTEFEAALPDLHAPGLNVMYGDAAGNVGWWATAQLYEIPDSVNTRFILEGSSGGEDPGKDLDFSHNPKAVNPPWGYVYSANNQPQPWDSTPYRGYYLPENRARRIVNLIESRSDWDKQSASSMILDHTSPVDPEVAARLYRLLDLDVLEGSQLALLDTLNQWKGDYPLHSTAATLYHAWIYHVYEATLADEIGEALFPKFMTTNVSKRMLPSLVESETSPWWDDVSTAEVKEDRRSIVRQAFQDAVTQLRDSLGQDASQWTWDRVHQLEHGHPLGQVDALRGFFNVGPFPVTGSREVINNMAFGYDGDGQHKVTAGPSTRRIIDFSDIENSLGILPTGQSGNPLSPHYNDQAEMFVAGEFRKMLMNAAEIRETASSVLILKRKD